MFTAAWAWLPGPSGRRQPGLALALIAVSLWPTAGVGARSLPGEADIRLALVLASALVLVALGAMHWQRWRLGLDRMQLALVVAAC